MEKLISIIENYSELDGITASTSFKNDLELSSFDTVCLIDEISAQFGVKIEIKDFISYKTIGAMAEYITSLQ